MSKLDEIVNSKAFYQENEFNRSTLKTEVKELFDEILKGEALTNPDKIRGCEKHHPNFTEYCNGCHTLKEYWRGYHVALEDVKKRVSEL